MSPLTGAARDGAGPPDRRSRDRSDGLGAAELARQLNAILASIGVIAAAAASLDRDIGATGLFDSGMRADIDRRLEIVLEELRRIYAFCETAAQPGRRGLQP